MNGVDALIPVIRSFLCDDLGSLPLPPTVDLKRRNLLERIDVITLGPTPTIPGATTPPAPSVQRRPLSSVVRLFSSSRKRFSLPASISYPPQLAEPADPPLPPKGSHRIPHSKSNEDYEVPRSIVDRLSENAAPSPLSGQPMLRQPLRSRHSMSPQLEIVQLNHCKTLISEPTPQLHPLAVTSDSLDDIALTLPKKSLTTQTRRFSAFMDSSWTVIGSLHHRHKPNKWIRLNMCLLTSGSRLIAYKSGHALTPSLVLFLCGATGVYAGRDSGMDFVIKIAHPTRGTTVLAADTEAQALVWIKQINLYAQGLTPSETYSFLDHPGLTNSPTNQQPTLSSVPVTPVRSSLSTDGEQHNGGLPAGPDVQEDSGFSAPVSSGSEGNSADGVVSGHSFQYNPALPESYSSSILPLSSPYACIPGTILIDSNKFASYGLSGTCTVMENFVESTCPSTSAVLVQADTVSCRSTTSSVTLRPRRESLLSSVRRKVESLNSKRRARKSLSQAFIPMERGPDLSKTMDSTEFQSKTNIECVDLPTDSSKSFTTAQNLPPSAAVPQISRTWGPRTPGFDWPQLESACGLFLKSPGLGSLPASSSGTRPHSFVASSALGFEDLNQSNIALINAHKHSPLVDLNRMRCCPHHQGVSISECESHVIVSGEACISIPGRVPWTNRWCVLRSHCLDIYPSTKPPLHTHPSNLSTMGDPATNQMNAWPVFSLTLEPGHVELGLAGDKYHKAALRLAVPKQSAAALLFDAPDKLQMGTWIRGFIEALGIIPFDPEKRKQVSRGKSVGEEHWYPTSMSPTSCTYDSPRDTYSSPFENLSNNQEPFSVSRDFPLCNGIHGDIEATFSLDDEADSHFEKNSSTIYDEVCPPQDSTSLLDFQSVGNRSRLNSSSRSVHQLEGSCFFARNLGSRPHFSGSISDDAPTESFHPRQVDRWYVPPPSRRLLAQPLPPLPSVGPSGAESVTGTITSSHASSSLTPDDLFPNQNGESPPTANSEPELLRSSTRKSVKTLSTHHRTSVNTHIPEGSGLRKHLSSSTRRRHSSLGSLDYQETTCLQLMGLDPDGVNSSPHNGRTIVNDEDLFLQDIEASTSHTGDTLHNGLSEQPRSQGTSVTHVGFPSDLSLLYQDDPHSLPWIGNTAPTDWPEDCRPSKPSCTVGARRSVSCLTAAKPVINDPRAVSTLPPRSELPSFVHPDPSNPNAFGDRQLTVVNDHSLSSNSSHTATSSGVALTAGSFSSGSGGTTRPSSMAISWPPQPPLTEEADLFASASTGINQDPFHSMVSARSLQQESDEEKHTHIVENIEETKNNNNTLSGTLPLRNPNKPTTKRTNTFSGVDRATQYTSSSPAPPDLHYSPTNASLLLVTTQLEEVQHGAKKLRSRHNALSFRLANRIALEQRNASTEDNPNNNKKKDTCDNSKPETSQSQETNKYKPIPIRSLSGLNVQNEEGDEATASLCARLSAIELLIQQAESIESRLRDEVSHYMSTNSKTSVELIPMTHEESGKQYPTVLKQELQRHHGRQQRLRSATKMQHSPDSNNCVSATTQQTARGRGRGRRNRRRRYYYGAGRGTGNRNPSKLWDQTETNKDRPVVVFPVSK